ncbi:MAG: S8 family serine peptidase [Planctomycetes bacterium]|nr:S8 family serine peptidase [Planctomycetota bacterium]
MLLSACFVLGALVLAPQDVDPAVVVRPDQPAAERALDAGLGQLARTRRERGEAAMREVAVARGLDLDVNGRVELFITRAGKGPALAALVAAGCQIEDVDADGITVRAAVGDAAQLKQLVSGIADVRLAPVAKSFAVSQGVGLTGGFAAQSLGADGAGVRLAIVDTGFNGYAALVNAGELPPATATKNFTGSSLESSSDHGAAVALIAHQMAPEAQLYLVKVGTLSHYKKAIDWLIDKKVHVFNASIGFLAANFSDGTGGAAAATNKARKHGILPVVSMGNYGDSHWIGAFADDDSDKLLNYTPTTEVVRFSAQAGSVVEIFLVWDDFPSTDIDLDVFLFDLGTLANPKPPTAQNIVATSTFDQTGSQQPIEIISTIAPSTGIYGITVNRIGKKPSQLALFTSHPLLDGLNVATSSLATPADADGAFSVAAMAHVVWASGPVEAFSSRGPATDGTQKPQITGPDGVANTVYPPFFGTSASAPHVAGAAALLKSVQPALTAEDLAQRLLLYAVPMGDVDEFGAGRLTLAADFLPPSPDPVEFDLGAFTITPTSITLAAGNLTDATGPLEYQFDSTSKAKEATDSGWIATATFVDDVLKPNRKYAYRFRARDAATLPNTTRWSAPLEIRTHALVPFAPTVSKIKSTSCRIKVVADGNPSSVLYAVQNVTTGEWLTPSGSTSGGAVFAKRTKWKATTVKGLTPATTYEFRVRAINSASVETVLGEALFVTTLP